MQNFDWMKHKVDKNKQILHKIQHFHIDGSRSPRLECSCIYIFQAYYLQYD